MIETSPKFPLSKNKLTVLTLGRKKHIFVYTQNIYSCITLCRCRSDLFTSFSQPPRPPISPEKSLIPSSDQPPSIRSRRTAHVQPRARDRSLTVYTRKRRGDGKHVCAMRTGIGVSLFRGGSDVLFHPRRRQSCRTAKTYHTIVSKFAHSLISRSFFHLSLSSFLFFSRRLLRWLSGGSLYIFIYFYIYLYISLLFVSSHHFLFFSFSSSSFTSRLFPYFIVAILSLVYPVYIGG